MNLLLVLALALTGSWPVGQPVVVRDFDPPAVNWEAGHRGLDLRAATGDPVYAIASGIVAFAGSIGGKPVVTVMHQGATGLRSTYEPVTASVQVGDVIEAGGLLGTVALGGGHCGGEQHCIHVGLRTGSAYVDPRLMIDRRPPVLKPAR